MSLLSYRVFLFYKNILLAKNFRLLSWMMPIPLRHRKIFRKTTLHSLAYKHINTLYYLFGCHFQTQRSHFGSDKSHFNFPLKSLIPDYLKKCISLSDTISNYSPTKPFCHAWIFLSFLFHLEIFLLVKTLFLISLWININI